jgi:flagellar basal body P-ring formation protein FlgA
MRLGRRIRTLLAASLLAVAMPPLAVAAGLTLPVPTTTIYPGETIDDGMVTEHTVQPSQIGRLMVVPDRAGLVGKVARRTLLPGRPVPVVAVAVPDLVARGVPVEIVFQEAGLTILAQAMSLEAGSAGEFIRVRNLDSGLIVTAKVQPDGTVRVGAP